MGKNVYYVFISLLKELNALTLLALDLHQFYLNHVVRKKVFAASVQQRLRQPAHAPSMINTFFSRLQESMIVKLAIPNIPRF